MFATATCRYDFHLVPNLAVLHLRASPIYSYVVANMFIADTAHKVISNSWYLFCLLMFIVARNSRPCHLFIFLELLLRLH